MEEESALLGDAPLTDRDRLIRAAMQTYRTNFNGNPKLPFGPARPQPPRPDLAGESNAWRTRTAAAVFLSLIILVTIGRFCFWWRRRKRWSLGIDDVLILLAAGVAAAYVGHVLSAFTEGTCLGRHMWFCTYEHIERLYMTFTIGQTIFYFSVYCSKLSLLFFIRRLTRDTSRVFNIIHWTLIPILICCGLISLLGTAFQCTPVWARWSFITLAKVDPADYKCISAMSFQNALRGMHIGTDIALLLYPASILKSLQMPLKKKIGIAFVFSFGLLCVMCSIVRNIIFGKKRPDYTYQSHDVYIWNMLDITSACIVPSLPSYYPIFNTVYRRIYGISTSIRDVASAHSISWRAKRSTAHFRQDTANSIDLIDVYEPHTKKEARSIASGDVGLLDATEPEPDRPSDVPENYVRQVPIVRVREPKNSANEVQQKFNEGGGGHV